MNNFIFFYVDTKTEYSSRRHRGIERENIDLFIKSIRKFLREQGEPIRRGSYRNSQKMAEKIYESKPPKANVFNSGNVNSLGRPEFISKMGSYLKTPSVKTSASRNPRRKLDLSGSTPYENESV